MRASQRLHLSCFDEEGAGALTTRQLEGYITALAPQLPGLAGLGAPHPAGDGSPSAAAAPAAPRGGESSRSGAAEAAHDEQPRLPQSAGMLSAAAGDPPGAAPPRHLGEAGDEAHGGDSLRGRAEGTGTAGDSARALGDGLGEYAAFAARKLMFLHARQGRRVFIGL